MILMKLRIKSQTWRRKKNFSFNSSLSDYLHYLHVSDLSSNVTNDGEDACAQNANVHVNGALEDHTLEHLHQINLFYFHPFKTPETA